MAARAARVSHWATMLGGSDLVEGGDMDGPLMDRDELAAALAAMTAERDALREALSMVRAITVEALPDRQCRLALPARRRSAFVADST
jgi:hypothetical protein